MISFRKATADDFENVHNINRELYDGDDPISYRETFEFLLSRPYNLGAIAELKGETVGFEMVSVMDAGKTIISRFRRVKPELQKKRISANLQLYTIQQLDPWCLGVTDHLYMNGFMGPEPENRRNATCVAKKAVFISEYVRSNEILEHYASGISPSFIQDVGDENQKFEILSSPLLAKELYGGDRVVIGMIPYKVMAENYDMIMENENPHLMVEIQNGRYLSVSYSSVWRLRQPDKCFLYLGVYARDPNKVVDHCLAQVKHVFEKNADKHLRLALIMDESFHAGSVGRKLIEKRIKNEIGIEPQEGLSDFHLVTFHTNELDVFKEQPKQIQIEEN